MTSTVSRHRINWVIVSFLIVFSFKGAGAQSKSIHNDSLSIQLIGIWQVNANSVASAFDDIYRFFPDGTFEFTFGANNEAGRIKTLRGRFHVSDDRLYTKITSRDELIMGMVKRGEPQFEPEWIIDDAQIRNFKQKDSQEESTTLLPCTSDKASSECFEIYGRPYFKLGNNPKEWK